MSVWNASFELTPAGSNAGSVLDDKIKELKTAHSERFNKEHRMYNSPVNPSAAGAAADDGYHQPGSAKPYYQATAPTARPDGVTLTSDDNGREWIDSATGAHYHYVHGTGWVDFGSVLGANGLVVKSGEPLMLDGLALRVKQVSIGNWNMQSTSSKSVSIGVASSKIISLHACICDDAYPTLYRYFFGGTDSSAGISMLIASDETLSLTRLSGSAYDSAGFDSTAFTRGYVNVVYFE